MTDLKSDLGSSMQRFDCEICKTAFSTKRSLINHMRKHSRGKLVCEQCQKEFSHILQNSHIHKDVLAYTKENPHVFEIGQKVYTGKSGHKYEHREPSEVKSYVCEMCLQPFSPKFVCDICPQTFFDGNSFEYHMCDHNDKIPHVCKICLKTFSSRYELVKHHRKLLVCEFCPKKCCSQKSLNIHMGIHTGEKSHMCDICQNAYYTQSELDSHFRTHSNSIKKSFICNICPKAFYSKLSLKRHMCIHTGEKPYACEICKQVFHNKAGLDLHFDAHASEGLYICEICHEVYLTKSGLDSHNKTHFVKKSFVCKVCQKAFFAEKSLELHMNCKHNLKKTDADKGMKISSVEKEYYLSKSGLDYHLNTHSGKKCFTCKVCQKAFLTDENLNLHMMCIHSFEKTCYDNDMKIHSVEQQYYPTKSGLDYQLNTHSVEKSFVCKICRKSFLSKENLKLHMCVHKFERLRADKNMKIHSVSKSAFKT